MTGPQGHVKFTSAPAYKIGNTEFYVAIERAAKWNQDDIQWK
jgi:hypothetical protein